MDRHGVSNAHAPPARAHSSSERGICSTPGSALTADKARLDTVRFEQTLGSERSIEADAWLKQRRKLKRIDGKGLFLKKTQSPDGFVYVVWEGSACQWAGDPVLFKQKLIPLLLEPEDVSVEDAAQAFAALRAGEEPLICRRLDVAFDFYGAMDMERWFETLGLLVRSKRKVAIYTSKGGARLGTSFRCAGEAVRLFRDVCSTTMVMYDKAREQKLPLPIEGDTDPVHWWRVEFRFQGRMVVPDRMTDKLVELCQFQVEKHDWLADLIEVVR